MQSSRLTSTQEQSPFCRFLKKQAVLDHVPYNIFQQDRCASHYMQNNNLLQTPVGMNEQRMRAGIQLPETVYYTVRLRGDHGNHPTPEMLSSLQTELAGIFKSAGFNEMPIACRDTWKADDWMRKELDRFDEVVPGCHGQEARCNQQKFQRTEGDMVLSFPFPASRIDDLCKAIAAVDTYRELHCGISK